MSSKIKVWAMIFRKFLAQFQQDGSLVPKLITAWLCLLQVLQNINWWLCTSQYWLWKVLNSAKPWVFWAKKREKYSSHAFATLCIESWYTNFETKGRFLADLQPMQNQRPFQIAQRNFQFSWETLVCYFWGGKMMIWETLNRLAIVKIWTPSGNYPIW